MTVSTVVPAASRPEAARSPLGRWWPLIALTLIAPDDLWLALGYVENPPGPRTPAEGLTPFDLLPGQAADMTLVWLWSGEPYASLGVGLWRFAILFTPNNRLHL